MPLIEGIAGQAAAAGMGLLLQKQQDKRQIRQQQKLQDQQIAGQQQMTDYNMSKQLQMWKDTNYSAQMAELKKAGLNPGLIYGMSGGGGVTTGQANGNVTGGQAPSGGKEMESMMGLGMQMQAQTELLKAQKENIEADTDNKRQQSPNIQSDTVGKDLKNKFDKDSMEDRLDITRGTFTKLQEEINAIHRDNSIGDETKEDKIRQIKAEAIGAELRNGLTKAQTAATTQSEKESVERIAKMGADISQGWVRLSIQEQEMKIKAFEAEIRANMPGVSQVMGGALQGMINSIKELMGVNPREGNIKPR